MDGVTTFYAELRNEYGDLDYGARFHVLRISPRYIFAEGISVHDSGQERQTGEICFARKNGYQRGLVGVGFFWYVTDKGRTAFHDAVAAFEQQLSEKPKGKRRKRRPGLFD